MCLPFTPRLDFPQTELVHNSEVPPILQLLLEEQVTALAKEVFAQMYCAPIVSIFGLEGLLMVSHSLVIPG